MDEKYHFSTKIFTLEAFTEFFQSVFAASHPEMDVEIVRGQKVTGLALLQGERIVSPMVRLDMLYDKYIDGKISLFHAFSEISAACEIYDARSRGLLDTVEDYRAISDRICFRLVNYEKNKKMLEEVPHTRWLDLALVLYIPAAVRDGKSLYLQVDNDLLGKWGITDTEELFKTAHSNTQGIFPGSIRDAEDVFADYGATLEAGMENDEDRMYIATNAEKFQGAAVVLYDGLLQSFAEGIGCNLYILPTSVSEMTIVADTPSVNAPELKELMANVNRELDEKDFLSNNVYYYDMATGETSIV